ncbi:hypothetical protein Tco_0559233 [Tanacetum coccineum]
MERVATTASSLEAKQDSSNINPWQHLMDQVLRELVQSSDPPLSRGYTLGSGEDSMKLLELMANEVLATAKANTVNGERQLQALVDKKRVIITESSIRSDLHLADAGGIDCLPTATIFEELARMRHPLLLNHYPLDLIRSSLGGNPRKKLKFANETHHNDDSVLDLEKAKDAQAKEIAVLKKRVQKLERKKKSRTTRLQRLRKVGESSRVESSEDTENDLHDDEVIVDMAVGVKQEKSAKIDEREPSKTKDKGKAIMIEPEVPLKRKDQVALNEEMARNLEAQLQAELIEEEKMARKKEEEANIALIESWENTQAMMEADRLLAERL